MPTLLERGHAMIARSLPKAAGWDVEYARGSDTCNLKATFGQSEFEIQEADGVRIVTSDRDFIVRADDLYFFGSLITPARGDRITILEDGHATEQVFEVLAPVGLQPYRWCDSAGTLIRIHTQRVS